jgi:HicA toxin of bacterial toxin-antitoxin,
MPLGAKGGRIRGDPTGHSQHDIAYDIIILWIGGLRRRIAQHPNAVRFEDLRRLLEAYGFERARIRGSHHIFVRGAEIQVVPFRRPHVRPI